MTITEIKIDGFRNVKDTILDFSINPILILLSNNNYGKTNLLQGIEEGFGLIRKQGTQVVDYIRELSYINKFKADGNRLAFTFGVRFFKKDSNKRYHYEFTIDGNTYRHGHEKGVISEYLEYDIVENDIKINEKPITLFQRCTTNLALATVYSSTDENGNKAETAFKASIEHGTRIVEHDNEEDKSNAQEYTPARYLFLHKLGNMALVGDSVKHNGKDYSVKQGSGLYEALKEIAGVLTSLTREDIGTILSDEGSDYRSAGALAKDAYLLESDNSVEYTHFHDSFCSMFAFDSFQPIKVGNEWQTVEFRGIHNETFATLSFGTRRVFKILSQIIANKTPLVSIEELELGMHTSLYLDVLQAFKDTLDSATYKKRNNENGSKEKNLRKNEPRLLISTHAPWLINPFDERLGSVYIGLQSYADEGCACFKTLNNKGQIEVLELVGKQFGGSVGAGDVIFKVLSDKLTRIKKEREWFD